MITGQQSQQEVAEELIQLLFFSFLLGINQGLECFYGAFPTTLPRSRCWKIPMSDAVRLACSPLSHKASASSRKTETQSAGLSSIFLCLHFAEDAARRTFGRLMAICSVWIASVSSPIFFLAWALIRWYRGCSRIWKGRKIIFRHRHMIDLVPDKNVQVLH